MPAVPKIEVYRDAAGKFRWRFRAPNGEIIAFSEAYESKDGCRKSIEYVKANSSKAEIVDITR
jgi:uncharacterized protein YegP (UPF0339 family)